MGIATMTSIDFYLRLPVREFAEINKEIAAEFNRLKK